ncbi:MAG: hypothetical protein KAX20_01270 [Candidatus Omnitrophica bacterium]|nr:hypothetical protein [Candidatus Omnitrophota bacterium]
MGKWIDQRDKGKEEEGIHCILCDQLCKNAYGLANHVYKSHFMPFSEYKRRLVENAEREYTGVRTIAFSGNDDYPKKNILHLFELLKEGWK